MLPVFVSSSPARSPTLRFVRGSFVTPRSESFLKGPFGVCFELAARQHPERQNDHPDNERHDDERGGAHREPHPLRPDLLIRQTSTSLRWANTIDLHYDAV